jgi:DNA-binding LacI/PurR family transcriptional regulator
VVDNAARHKDSAGFLLWIDSRHLLDSTAQLADKLLQSGKPVVAIDVDGTFDTVFDRFRSRRLSLFRLADVMAGVHAARFLIGAGHQNVAYFSMHMSNDPWSERRYQGIIRGFADAGLDRSRVTLIDNNGRQVSDGSAKARSESAQTDKNVSAAISVITSTYPDPSFSDMLIQQVGNQKYVRIIQECMASHFNRALENKKITAWITESEGMAALAALPFHLTHRVRVPQDISLIGFDNTWLSFGNDLTTFDYELDKVAYRALEIALAPAQRATAAPKPAAIFDISGSVLARRTTGPAKGI